MNQPLSICDSNVIARFLQNELSLEEQSNFEIHLDQCDSCCDQLREGTASNKKWADVARHLSDSSDLSSFGEEMGGPAAEIDLDFLDPTDDPHMLGRFAGYEIVGVIGVGGMGIVMKGFDRALNRFSAIKVLKPHYASSAAARIRFAREARAAAAVVHENVVAIHGVSVSGTGISESQPDSESPKMARDKLPYLVMPYVRGESLQKRLDRCGVLSTAEVLRISMQVALGLAAAHEQGLVHRDIKPANILLPEDVERVKITDFGLARAADDASLTRTGVIAGTPQYMSPEQAQGEAVTNLSDLFSLGSVMYTMCTGRIPFRAESPLGVLRRIADEDPKPVSEVNHDVPKWLCQTIARLHSKRPEDRPRSASEVAMHLRDCLAHVQQPTKVSLPMEANSRDSKKPLGLTNKFFRSVIFKGVFLMTVTTSLILVGVCLWHATFEPQRSSSENLRSKINTSNKSIGSDNKQKNFEKEFVVSFTKPNEVGVLDVDIKRGDILVTGYDGTDVIVKLTIPNYVPDSKDSKEGLARIRPNNPDFDIRGKNNRIEVDSNTNQYTTNLEIKVPRNTNLILDSYWDGVIKVSQVSGEMNLRSQNNDISMINVSGSAKVWSYNGNVVAVFDAVTVNKPLNFESYNGSVDLKLPADIRATVSFSTKTGMMLTDFDIKNLEDAVRVKSTKQDGLEIKFDELVKGEINGGGQSLKIETEKGDIRLRKHKNQPAASMKRLMQELNPDNHPEGFSAAGGHGLDARLKAYQAIKAFVESDQMPEYLMHAAHAGLLEFQREQAIKQLEVKKALQIEAELLLDYEKAIQSYEAMMENPSWRKRFPAMDLKDTAPYRRRLDSLKAEFSKRHKQVEK